LLHSRSRPLLRDWAHDGDPCCPTAPSVRGAAGAAALDAASSDEAVQLAADVDISIRPRPSAHEAHRIGASNQPCVPERRAESPLRAAVLAVACGEAVGASADVPMKIGRACSEADVCARRALAGDDCNSSIGSPSASAGSQSDAKAWLAPVLPEVVEEVVTECVVNFAANARGLPRLCVPSRRAPSEATDSFRSVSDHAQSQVSWLVSDATAAAKRAASSGAASSEANAKLAVYQLAQTLEVAAAKAVHSAAVSALASPEPTMSLGSEAHLVPH